MDPIVKADARTLEALLVCATGLVPLARWFDRTLEALGVPTLGVDVIVLHFGLITLAGDVWGPLSPRVRRTGEWSNNDMNAIWMFSSDN